MVWPFSLNKNRMKQNNNVILSHTVYPNIKTHEWMNYSDGMNTSAVKTKTAIKER